MGLYVYISVLSPPVTVIVDCKLQPPGAWDELFDAARMQVIAYAVWLKFFGGRRDVSFGAMLIFR